MKDLFKDHLDSKVSYVRALMDKKNLDSLIVDSGLPQYYFQDDQSVPFRPNPHFLYFCPDKNPGHLLQIMKEGKPKLFYFNPDDFWHDSPTFESTYWMDEFDLHMISSEDLLWKSLDTNRGCHRCLTPQPEKSLQNNLELVDDHFLSALCWSRISKTEYEIRCIKEANRIASLGHIAAKDSFFRGLSERQTFQNYLSASHQLQFDLPYGNIIAYNEKTAILHYQNSRDVESGKTFLIDAGASYNGYCSDISRTYYQNDVHEIFISLHTQLEKDQLTLVDMVAPGIDYQLIQDETHRLIAKNLIDNKVLLCDSTEQALELDLVTPFFPHGVGHALGLQVHDVGGKQLDEEGTPSPKNSKYPFLRTLRTIQENDVLTIEPGLYFIPMLLQEFKEDKEADKLINWSLVEELLPLGGMRIEDDVVARKGGCENLTRPFLP